MAIKKLENAVYTATDWQDEIASKDLLKIGYSKIEWDVVGDDVIVKTGSGIDVAGNIYLIESDETITGPVTDKYITFDGTTFATDDTALLWDEAKNGYYLSATNTRVIGYLNAGVLQSVIKDIGFLDVLNATTINADITGDVTGNLSGYVTGGCKFTSSGSFTITTNPTDYAIGTDGDGFYLVSGSSSFAHNFTTLVPAGATLSYVDTTYYWKKFG